MDLVKGEWFDLYKDTTTPDGFYVDADGVWDENAAN